VTSTGAVDSFSRDPPSAKALTKQLIVRAIRNKGTSTAQASTVFAACEATYRAISRCIGTSGAQALLARALAEANKTHPLLRNVRVDLNESSSQKHPDAAVDLDRRSPSAGGLEALLEMLITLLARFVGMDMVVQLLAHSATVVTMEGEDAQ
jgi:hypothetical protein